MPVNVDSCILVCLTGEKFMRCFLDTNEGYEFGIGIMRSQNKQSHSHKASTRLEVYPSFKPPVSELLYVNPPQI